MSSLIRELDPLPPSPPRPPYTPHPYTPPIPRPLKGEALKRRQQACISSHSFVHDGKEEPYWTAAEINAICLVDNPPIYEGPIHIPW